MSLTWKVKGGGEILLRAIQIDSNRLAQPQVITAGDGTFICVWYLVMIFFFYTIFVAMIDFRLKCQMFSHFESYMQNAAKGWVLGDDESINVFTFIVNWDSYHVVHTLSSSSICRVLVTPTISYPNRVNSLPPHPPPPKKKKKDKTVYILFWYVRRRLKGFPAQTLWFFIYIISQQEQGPDVHEIK